MCSFTHSFLSFLLQLTTFIVYTQLNIFIHICANTRHECANTFLGYICSYVSRSVHEKRRKKFDFENIGSIPSGGKVRQSAMKCFFLTISFSQTVEDKNNGSGVLQGSERRWKRDWGGTVSIILFFLSSFLFPFLWLPLIVLWEWGWEEEKGEVTSSGGTTTTTTAGIKWWEDLRRQLATNIHRNGSEAKTVIVGGVGGEKSFGQKKKGWF